MLKIAVIAYLSLTTVLGPALCCCNAQQLFSILEGSTCCGKLASGEISESEPYSHCSHHGHAHHRHEHPATTGNDTTDDLPPAGHQHDKQDCPCGEHHATLVAATDAANWNRTDLLSQTWFELALATPALPEFGGPKAVLVVATPAHLYGREMLRAYQIMRC